MKERCEKTARTWMPYPMSCREAGRIQARVAVERRGQGRSKVAIVPRLGHLKLPRGYISPSILFHVPRSVLHAFPPPSCLLLILLTSPCPQEPGYQKPTASRPDAPPTRIHPRYPHLRMAPCSSHRKKRQARAEGRLAAGRSPRRSLSPWWITRSS